MSRLTFIEVHKQSLESGKYVSDANRTILNVTAIHSVAKYDDHAVIELIGRDRGTFSVTESYEEVVGMISQAGGGKVNRINEVARG